MVVLASDRVGKTLDTVLAVVGVGRLDGRLAGFVEGVFPGIGSLRAGSSLEARR
jgi:hypothetical protein